jgi:hypothetical protein
VPVEVDWTHPLAWGLIAAYLPAMGSPAALPDLCGRAPTLRKGTAAAKLTVSPAGVALSPTTTLGDMRALTTAGPYRPTSNISLVWYGTADTDACPTDDVLLSLATTETSDGTTALFCIRSVSNGTWGYGYNNFTQYGQTIAHKAGPHCLVGSWITGGVASGANFYIDGVLANTGTAAGAPTYGGSPAIQFGSGLSTSVNRSVLGLIFGRALSAGEARQLASAPFAMLRPVARRAYSYYSATNAAAGRPYLTFVG